MTDLMTFNSVNYDGSNDDQQKIVDAEEWCEQIYQDIVQNKKRLVFISGASSSGKGTNAKLLARYLAERGIRGLHIEADMYYKGVARIITEKVIQQPEFKKYASSCADIYNALLSVNKYDRLENKFNIGRIDNRSVKPIQYDCNSLIACNHTTCRVSSPTCEMTELLNKLLVPFG